jgi:hypothetical protein
MSYSTFPVVVKHDPSGVNIDCPSCRSISMSGTTLHPDVVGIDTMIELGFPGQIMTFGDVRGLAANVPSWPRSTCPVAAMYLLLFIVTEYCCGTGVDAAPPNVKDVPTCGRFWYPAKTINKQGY